MAVIQKIRTKYGKLAGAVIAIALVGFIFMDAASGRFGDLFRGNKNNVVKVNGEKVGIKEYSQWMKEYETLYTIYNGGHSLDDAQRAQMNEQALKLLVYEKIAEQQCKKLGIASTAKEQDDLIYGASASPMVQQFKIQNTQIFDNPETGLFDPQRVKAFEQQIDQLDPTGKIRDEWEAVKDYVIRTNVINKYNALFVNAVYTPKFLIAKMQNERNDDATVKFVKVPLTNVNDNEVKVNDDDIKAYMQKHAAQFTVNEPSRSIEYVSFDIKPSSADTTRTMTALQQIKDGFANAKDADAFVARNSDDVTKTVFANKRTLLTSYADSIFNTTVGGVYGPYFENNDYKLTKVVSKGDMPDSVVCSFIIIRTKGGGQTIMPDSVAKVKMDTVQNLLKSGVDFKALALKYSDDSAQAKTNNAQYTFTAQQRVSLEKAFSKDFSDFLFNGKPGETKMMKIDNDNYSGYLLAKVVDQKGMQPTVQIATITKSLYAGDNTVNGEYAKATAFAGRNANAKSFDDAILKENLNKRLGENVKKSDFTIEGLGSAREIIKWMYDDAKVGDVSSVFSLDGRYVVAKLVSVQDKGIMNINATNRPMLEAAVRAEKKADLIANKYKSPASLDAVAQSSGQQVQQVDTLSLGAGYVQNLGYEPKVQGYAFYSGFKTNTVSPAIKGNNGVYFINVASRWQQPANASDSMMMRQQQLMMQTQMKNGVGQLLPDMMIKNADVSYNVDNL